MCDMATSINSRTGAPLYSNHLYGSGSSTRHLTADEILAYDLRDHLDSDASTTSLANPDDGFPDEESSVSEDSVLDEDAPPPKDTGLRQDYPWLFPNKKRPLVSDDEDGPPVKRSVHKQVRQRPPVGAGSSSTMATGSIASNKLSDEQILDLLSWVPHEVRSYPDVPKEDIKKCKVLWVDGEASSDMGMLDRLPPEIMDMVVTKLDPASLFRLHQTCRRANLMVHRLPNIEKMFKELLWLVSGLRAVGCRRKVKFLQAGEAMMNGRCSRCRRSFGQWVFLPTLERACFKCISIKKDFRLINAETLRKAFNFTAGDLRQIGFYLTVPCRWQRDTYTSLDRFKERKLIPLQAAKKMALSKGKTMKQYHQAFIDQIPFRMKSMTDHQIQIALMCHSHGSTEGSLLNYESHHDDFRGLASWPLPTVTNDGSLDYGYYCFGCILFRLTGGRAAGHDDRYDDAMSEMKHTVCRSRDRFLRHVEKCEVAQLIIEGLEKGTITPTPGRNRTRERKLAPSAMHWEEVEESLIGDLPGMNHG
ncbi:hypothetical protein BDZ85DRAFT_92011 [Elsinoe ampelina]|uniref:F-box domain-containing protein n=1 Tax=Elsinoe ampelina TaxID=302913 RepID=A0A6A6GI81_9PEZI|nr:hypothetical protein BDZ85DRAFT_92011 [Elsinoe ampelina]